MLIFKSTTWRELARTRPRGTLMVVSFVGVYTAPFLLLLFLYNTCQSFKENTTKSCPKTSSIQYASMSLVCIIILFFGIWIRCFRLPASGSFSTKPWTSGAGTGTAFNVFWTNQDGAFAEGILRSLDMLISALGFHCHCHYIRNNRYKPIVFLKHVSQALNLPAVQRGSSSKNYIRSFLRSNFIKQKSLINSN